MDRELKPFFRIRYSYPCVLVTMDKTLSEDYGGVKHMNALDFLCGAPLP